MLEEEAYSPVLERRLARADRNWFEGCVPVRAMMLPLSIAIDAEALIDAYCRELHEDRWNVSTNAFPGILAVRGRRRGRACCFEWPYRWPRLAHPQ